MKKATLVLLCCSAFLYACDSSRDTANDAVSGVNDKAAGGIDSAKESASVAIDATSDTASETMAEGKELEGAAVENANAAVSGTIESAEEMSSAAVTETSDAIASVGADGAEQGESLYKSKCVACHGSGAAGAPKLDDKAAWETRIAQGNEILTQHAIEGFKGNTGYMPPKGGYMSLSDNDISLVVQYMVSQAQ